MASATTWEMKVKSQKNESQKNESQKNESQKLKGKRIKVKSQKSKGKSKNNGIVVVTNHLYDGGYLSASIYSFVSES
ncbi:MAG: hypothetical protein SWX82_23270 [Cyanobacteriota bacterium]|nr:hypothetical protein [Cyanobacteriota bacterium]